MINKKTIDLSVCPLFSCNLNCSFCYLGKLKQQNNILDLNILENLLSEYDIRVLDLYGGEITLLEDSYVKRLFKILNKYHDISMTSNAINFIESPIFKNLDSLNFVNISFSYDLCRDNNDLIRKSIFEFDDLNIPYSVISLDTDVLDYRFLNRLENLQTLSLKPYSPSVNNKTKFKNMMLTNVKELYDKYPNLFQKLELVNSFRDKVPHCFLLPDGKLYNIQYDEVGYEKFVTLQDCKSDISYKCLSCKYFGKCFNEHYGTYDPDNGLSDECLGRIKTMEFLEKYGY